VSSLLAGPLLLCKQAYGPIDPDQGWIRLLLGVVCGDTLIDQKLDRLVRSVRDPRDIADSLIARGKAGA
jgi:hypothetical protein